MKILFLRHAESLGNCEQRMIGQLEDHLSDQGRQQASQLGSVLVQQVWQPTHLYSSPLQRAFQTAQLLSQAWPQDSHRPALETVDALKEIHPGIFQGLTWSQAQAQYPELCVALERSPTWIPIPGAESLAVVRDRAHGFIQMLLKGHENGDRIWAVTHGGLLPYLISELFGSPKVWGLEIPSLALFEFEVHLNYWESQDQNCHNPTLWQIHRFNQCVV